MRKTLVAAMAENNVIGKNGELPWHYPEDLKHFRQLTTGHPVVMGRKTFESLPDSSRPLPDRTNIVLTRAGVAEDADIEEAENLEEAWKIAEEIDDRVFIIGGASIYEQTLPEADEMVITRIHEDYEGDARFPEWDEENWEEVERNDREELSFVTYRRL